RDGCANADRVPFRRGGSLRRGLTEHALGVEGTQGGRRKAEGGGALHDATAIHRWHGGSPSVRQTCLRWRDRTGSGLAPKQALRGRAARRTTLGIPSPPSVPCRRLSWISQVRRSSVPQELPQQGSGTSVGESSIALLAPCSTSHAEAVSNVAYFVDMATLPRKLPRWTVIGVRPRHRLGAEFPILQIGFAWPGARQGDVMATTIDTRAEDILESLTRVVDPAYGINIVDLGVVYGIEVFHGRVRVEMAVPSSDPSWRTGM